MRRKSIQDVNVRTAPSTAVHKAQDYEEEEYTGRQCENSPLDYVRTWTCCIAPTRTMRFGSTAKVLLKCKLKYYRISECTRLPSNRLNWFMPTDVWISAHCQSPHGRYAQYDPEDWSEN